MARFTPRERKHRKLARKESASSTTDTNIEVLIPEKRPVQKADVELPRKVSGKKAKRLEHYLETKLRREENLELLKKLAESKVDTSSLQSSKTLGKRKFTEYANGHTKRLPVAGSETEDPQQNDQSESSDADLDEGDEAGANPGTEDFASTTNGAGLKGAVILGPDGLPIMQTNARKKPTVRATVIEEPSEDSWGGFSDESEQDESVESKSDKEGSDSDPEMNSEEITGADSTDSDTSRDTGPPKRSGFKVWATAQINKSLNFVPYASQEIPANVVHTESLSVQQPHIPKLDDTQARSSRQAHSIIVERSLAIRDSRAKLPVLAAEQEVMEAIHNNPVVIVWGETGSGKTTQIPQFLFEAGYGTPKSDTPGLIGITQPRRVAAVSMANRVSEELGEYRSKVAYQIRFDSTLSKDTAIKFMTDGILLRELQEDVFLKKYSVIVLDEAHERSVNTDILIGMLSRICETREKLSNDGQEGMRPLKLVIMSATLRFSDFLRNRNLFRAVAPQLVKVEGRQFPVTTHFSRQTKGDYVEEIFTKLCRGHKKLPSGGMLVFLTGQQEIHQLLRRLRKALPSTTNDQAPTARLSEKEFPLETEDMEFNTRIVQNEHDGYEEQEDAVLPGLDSDSENDEFDIQESDEKIVHGNASKGSQSVLKIHILPLYSQLPTKEQLKVFKPPPPGSRLVVLATNVAETSITIPGIRYVFDSGRSKERKYDIETGVQSFEVDWISKASAEQRRGRAGRTEPGHCYRLYSSALYERDFPDYAEPEILRTPLENVVLQLKAMDIPSITKFPFPTPPDQLSLIKAEKLLRNLGALQLNKDQITPLGEALNRYPVNPRLAKLLVNGNQRGCLPFVIALAAAMTISELFIQETQISGSGNMDDSSSDDDTASSSRSQRKAYNRAHATLSSSDPTSDALKLLSAIGLASHEKDQDTASTCADYFLHHKAISEALHLRRQLTSLVSMQNPTVELSVSPLPRPSALQISALKQMLAACYIDQLAIRADLLPNPPPHRSKPRRAIDVPYLPLVPLASSSSLTTDPNSQYIYIHPSSVLSSQKAATMPKYLAYHKLQRSAGSTVTGPISSDPSINATMPQPKIRMFPLCPVSEPVISTLAFGTPLLHFSKPLPNTLKEIGKDDREAVVVPSLRGADVGIGWPLPARKVLQRRDADGRGDWIVERFL